MKTKSFLTILIGLILCCAMLACTRRSGYSTNNNRPCTTQRTQQTQKQEITPPVNLPQKTTTNNGILSASEVFEKYNTAVFMIYTSNGGHVFQGSGFFIASDGLAVSNYHVFKNSGIGLEVIKLSDGTQCKVREVVAKNEEYDFILFYVDIERICNYIPITNRTCKVGEKIFTIGSPQGLENTFSSGEISQLRGNYVIQINAPIDHGSSGGALINEYGEVVGITTSGYDDSGANLNFAVDINVIKPYITKSEANRISDDSKTTQLTTEEYRLYELVMEYRASKNIPTIPISPSLTFVARTHVRDLTAHPPTGECNLHSWSEYGNWTPCCYTDDHAEAENMWNKPRELTSYQGNGYEIAFGHFIGATPENALEGWKTSPGHNAVMVNLNIWKNITWRAIGIGIYGNYAVIWFGEEFDTTKDNQ